MLNFIQEFQAIVLYWIWRVGIWLAIIAPQELSIAAAGVMGHSAYYLMPLRRRIAKDNFSQVLGKSPNDPEVRRVARESFKNYARYLRDVMLYPQATMEELEQRIQIHGSENIEAARALGKGIIIVSAHFGNMDLASAVLAKHFGPITLIGETMRPQQMMDYLTRIRKIRDVHLFPYTNAPRKMIEALKRNEMAAFLLDFGITHHFDMATVPVTFFAKPTKFPVGPAQLAQMTGAAIIVGNACVAPDGHIQIDTTPPIIVKRTQDRHADWQKAMQEIAHRMESFIRKYPDQWYVFRPMWLNDHRSVVELSSPQTGT